MSKITKVSNITQNADRDCNINVTTIHCNAVTVSSNDFTASISTNISLLLSPTQHKTAYEDLQKYFHDFNGLSIERILNVLKLTLSTKEDKEKREKFLKTHISHDHAFDILNLTCELNNLILRDITEHFIVNNIKEITENEKIPKISEDRLENIFKKNSDKLNIKDFFITVKKWKDKNVTERRNHFCRFMRTISNKIFESDDMELITIDLVNELDDCESCMQISKEIIRKQVCPDKKSNLLCLIVNPENFEYDIIKIFNFYEHCWDMHIDIESNLKWSSNIIMNNTLILVGGTNVKNQITNGTFRFDVKSKKILPMGLMNAKRECCALTVLDNNLYVTGGRDPNKKTLSSVEVWNPTTNEWVYVQEMKKKRLEHAAVTLNGKIYVFGGHYFDGKTFVYHKSIEIYDSQKGDWTYIEYDTGTSYLEVSGKCLALPIKDKILYYDSEKREKNQLKIFCTSTEKITYQSSVPCQDYYDLISLDEKIIFIGDPKNYLYNLEEKSWTEYKLPVKPTWYNTTFSYSHHV